MTFTEAALEVLRSAGEPLHYKRITELAIERNLLSHVGKTPEVTMSSRLAMMVKKDRGQAPIMKVKPGVFAIRESALQDFAAAAAAAAAMEAEATSDDASGNTPVPAKVEAPPLPGADVFPEEEGDDDPILAGLEQEGEGGDKTGRRRRRRRRRGKGSERGDAPVEAQAPRADAPREREPSRDRPRELRDPRDVARDRDHARGPRDMGRDNHRDSGRDAGRDAGRDNGREPVRDRPDEMAQLDWNRAPGEGDLLGRDLADAVWIVLSRGERAPHSFVRVAELLVRRGRLSGNPAGLAPTIAAAVRADISRAELAREHSRFRLRSGRLSLSEWLQSKPLARAEQDLLAAADRYGAELRRSLIYKLGDLPAAGFAELIATWLNAEGVTALRALRRPGSSISEFHFAGTCKRGSEETRLALVVQRGVREVDREAVVEVRGSLQHYGQAQSAWIITSGRITSGAREEAALVGAAPVALFDGMAVATAMERLGIAVHSHVITHHEIDFDLFEALGDTTELRRERELRERGPEPRRPEQRSSRDGGRGDGQRSSRDGADTNASQNDRERAMSDDQGVASAREDGEESRETDSAGAPQPHTAQEWDEGAEGDDLPDLPEGAEDALDREDGDSDDGSDGDGDADGDADEDSDRSSDETGDDADDADADDQD